MTTSKTTKTDEPTTEGFSFAAWLGNGSRPERYVTLYAANAYQAEIDAIEKELAEAEQAAAGTFGGASGTAALEKRLGELQKQIAKSGAVFKVRAVDQEALARIEKAHPLKDDISTEERGHIVITRWMEQVASQIVAFGPDRDNLQPVTFTVEQVRELRSTIGEVEYDRLLGACMECMSEVSASRPFWRGNSGSNATS